MKTNFILYFGFVPFCQFCWVWIQLTQTILHKPLVIIMFLIILITLSTFVVPDLVADIYYFNEKQYIMTAMIMARNVMILIHTCGSIYRGCALCPYDGERGKCESAFFFRDGGEHADTPECPRPPGTKGWPGWSSRHHLSCQTLKVSSRIT